MIPVFARFRGTMLDIAGPARTSMYGGDLSQIGKENTTMTTDEPTALYYFQ